MDGRKGWGGDGDVGVERSEKKRWKEVNIIYLCSSCLDSTMSKEKSKLSIYST